MQIENTKQQQLTFDKGITNVPSDAICSDNTLAESVGMVYDDGEHRVIQRPSEFITSAVSTEGTPIYIRLLYVHKLNAEERYVALRILNEDSTVYYYPIWGTTSGTVFTQKGTLGDRTTEIPQITSIGKTLILSKKDGLDYFLWNKDTYKHLGDKIPEPKLSFCMADPDYTDREDKGEFTITDKHEKISWKRETRDNTIYFEEEYQADYNDFVVGLYSKLIKQISEEKLFSRPFVLRYAVELYDGTYTLHSSPIIMLPAVTSNLSATFYFGGNDNKSMKLSVYGRPLVFKGEYDYSEWSDVVKNVVVFASEQVKLYDTTGDQNITNPSERFPLVTVDAIYADSSKNGGIKRATRSFWSNVEKSITDGTSKYHKTELTKSTEDDYYFNMLPLKRRSTQDIVADIAEKSVFYKLFEAGKKSDGQWKPAAMCIKEHVIENITTQEQLTSDYFVHQPMSASFMSAYNSRLLLAGVERGFYEGFTSFLPYDNAKAYTYTVYVYINIPGGDRVVKKTYTTTERVGIFFYYTDPRAYKAVIFTQSGFLSEIELVEHSGLNGAFYFAHLPDGTEQEPTPTASDVTMADCEASVDVTPEHLYNQLFNSETNNPFVFAAEGNITVGNGRIIGMTTLTQALSQGQFGQYPLIVFTDEGIWAASVGTTGLFTAVHPMSREVCNNPQSITQTDGAVFFTSSKGLMVVAGSTVKCVSEQMSGRTDDFAADTYNPSPTALGHFAQFLERCFIAYDYRDSLLWIFNEGKQCCYVYAIKSGTFSKYILPEPIRNVVNNYPDYLMQSAAGTAYSLLRRPDINADDTTYDAQMLTRPMKLENAMALKMLVQIRHVHLMEGDLKIRIYASNTLKSWAELHSLLSTPMKYYRILYTFTAMRATDRFSGSVIVTKETRTNKLR